MMNKVVSVGELRSFPFAGGNVQVALRSEAGRCPHWTNAFATQAKDIRTTSLSKIRFTKSLTTATCVAASALVTCAVIYGGEHDETIVDTFDTLRLALIRASANGLKVMAVI
jgi:hypothetical protein